MRIQQALEKVLTERVLDRVTADQYQRAVRRFEESLGRPAEIEDLNYANINAWLASMQLAPVTICNYRRSILMLWNYLASIGDIPPYAKQRIRRPKVVPHIVRSWDVEQLGELLAATERVHGSLRCGMPASEFLKAWLWVGFDTGLRPIDLRLLQWKHVDSERGCVTIVQNKTKQSHTAVISDDAIKSLRSIRTYDARRVFPLSKGGVRRWELRLFKVAESIGFMRNVGEGLGRLRSLHATEIYRSDGLSAAAESLGHVGGTRTVRAHYIDARAVHMGRLPNRRPGCGKRQGGT